MLRLNRILATWFGCGLVPRAPGTVGTLGAVPLFLWLNTWPPFLYMAAVIIFVLLAIFVAQIYEVEADHDASEFVMDEVAGFLLTMTWIPLSALSLLFGFALFRLFDIVKPWPISFVDRKMGGGAGTVCDDVLAGLAANFVLQVLLGQGLLP